MANSRIIERIGVKVIPDLTGFRTDLVKKLRAMPGVSVEIEAHLGDLTKVKAELEHITRDRDIDFNVKVNEKNLPNIGKKFAEDMKRSERQMDESLLRIQRAFDDVIDRRGIDFAVDLNMNDEQLSRFNRDLQRIVEQYSRDHAIHPGIELDESHKQVFEEKLDELIRDYDGQNIDLDVNADSFWASRQLSWVSRTRIVDLYVRVNEQSLTAAATTIAALSGGRLLGDVGEDVWDFFRDLDRNIPSLTMWTTGIINLTGSLVGMMTQLITFGADVARIGPMFLTLPGLAMGAVTALMVTMNAWANVKDELAALADPITNLRDLMNDSYWDEARGPITDLVMNLMPQLEVVLTNASRAMGAFAGAFASALEDQLGGGRLEEIFGTMEEGFQILAQGAEGYAGTLVNMALIAGRYWPRLAEWMNRQASSFSNWMDAIITDGRLDAWMERAIDNLYELGYGLADMGRLLRGLTTAAEAAGSVGLAGFHDTMERWQEVINSANGQKALIDYFTGGRLAAEGLGDAIEAIFVGLAKVSGGVRDTLGQSGSTIAEIGHLFGDVLGNSALWSGLETMLARMESGVGKLRSASDEIAEFLGAGAEVVGHFADELAGPLSAALEIVLPRLSSLQGPFESLITALSTGLEELIRTPQFGKLLDNLVELVEILINLALDAIPVVLPVLESLLSLLASQPAEVWLLWLGSAVVIGGLIKFAQFAGPAIKALGGLSSILPTATTGAGKFGTAIGGAGGALKAVGWTAVAAVAVGALSAIGDAVEDSIASLDEWKNALETSGDVDSLLTSGFKVGGASSGYWSDVFGISDLEQVQNYLDKIDLVQLRDSLDPFGFSSESQFLDSAKNLGDALAQLHSQSIPAAVDQFNDLREQLQLNDEQAANLVDNSGAYRDALYNQATALGINMTALSDAEQRQVLLAIATGDATVATGDAADALDSAGSYFSDYSRFVDGAADAVDRLVESQQELNELFWDEEGSLRNASKNLREFEEQMQSVLNSGESAVTADGWFNYDTDAGYDASLFFENMIRDQNDALTALEELGVGVEQLDQIFADSEEAIRNWGAQLGLDPALIELLVEQLVEPGEKAVQRYIDAGEESAREFSRAFDGALEDNPFSRFVEGGAPGGALDAIPTRFAETGEEAIRQFRDAIEAYSGVDAGARIGESIAQGLSGVMPGVQETAHTLTRHVDTSMQELAGHGFTRAVEMGAGMDRGLSQAQASAVAAVVRIVMAMSSAMNVLNGVGFGVGASLGQGMARGIQSTIALVAASAAALVHNATAAAKRAGDIHSPSRLWDREIGYQLGAGGARGITRSASLMANAARDAIPIPALEGFTQGGTSGSSVLGSVTFVSKNDDPGEDVREVVHYMKAHASGGVV